MSGNAKRRRVAKLKARGFDPTRRQPERYLSLIGRRGWLVTHFGMTVRAAREALRHGKVNVNGKVWGYPEVPINSIETDDFGRYRIMVEGVKDTRPTV